MAVHSAFPKHNSVTSKMIAGMALMKRTVAIIHAAILKTQTSVVGFKLRMMKWSGPGNKAPRHPSTQVP